MLLADHDWEARDGNVSVDPDASKIIDAPLSEMVSRAEKHDTSLRGIHRVSAIRWPGEGPATPRVVGPFP